MFSEVFERRIFMKAPRKIVSTLMAALLVATAVMTTNAESVKLNGKDRYDTAIKISNYGWGSGAQNAILINAYSVADALAAGPYAKKINAPVLLTGNDSLNESTNAELKRLKTKNITIIGGENSISSKVEKNLKKSGYNVERIFGADRYKTSLEIADKVGMNSTGELFVVNGVKGLPDAAAVGATAAKLNTPLIFINGKDTNGFKQLADKLNAKKVYYIGGTAGIPSNFDTLFNSISSVSAERVAGPNRRDTNAKLIEKFYPSTLPKVYVANNGQKNKSALIDSVALAGLAGREKAPIVLADPSADLSETQDTVLNRGRISQVISASGGMEDSVTEIENLNLKSDEVRITFRKSGGNGSLIGSTSIITEKGTTWGEISSKLPSARADKGYKAQWATAKAENVKSNSLPSSSQKIMSSVTYVLTFEKNDDTEDWITVTLKSEGTNGGKKETFNDDGEKTNKYTDRENIKVKVPKDTEFEDLQDLVEDDEENDGYDIVWPNIEDLPDRDEEIDEDVTYDVRFKRDMSDWSKLTFKELTNTQADELNIEETANYSTLKSTISSEVPVEDVISDEDNNISFLALETDRWDVARARFKVEIGDNYKENYEAKWTDDLTKWTAGVPNDKTPSWTNLPSNTSRISSSDKIYTLHLELKDENLNTVKFVEDSDGDENGVISLKDKSEAERKYDAEESSSRVSFDVLNDMTWSHFKTNVADNYLDVDPDEGYIAQYKLDGTDSWKSNISYININTNDEREITKDITIKVRYIKSFADYARVTIKMYDETEDKLDQTKSHGSMYLSTSGLNSDDYIKDTDGELVGVTLLVKKGTNLETLFDEKVKITANTDYVIQSTSRSDSWSNIIDLSGSEIDEGYLDFKSTIINENAVYEFKFTKE